MSFQSVYAMPLLSSHSEQHQIFLIVEYRTNYHLQLCRQTILRRLGMSLRVAITHFLNPSLVRIYSPYFLALPPLLLAVLGGIQPPGTNLLANGTSPSMFFYWDMFMQQLSWDIVYQKPLLCYSHFCWVLVRTNLSWWLWRASLGIFSVHLLIYIWTAFLGCTYLLCR